MREVRADLRPGLPSSGQLRTSPTSLSVCPRRAAVPRVGDERLDHYAPERRIHDRHSPPVTGPGFDARPARPQAGRRHRRRPEQAVRPRARRRRPDLQSGAWNGDRLPRSERGREDDDAPDAARAREAERGHCPRLWRALRGDPEPGSPSRRSPGGNRLPSWPLRPGSPADARLRGRSARAPRRRGAVARRALERFASPRRRLLARYAAAARPRRRAAWPTRSF